MDDNKLTQPESVNTYQSSSNQPIPDQNIQPVSPIVGTASATLNTAPITPIISASSMGMNDKPKKRFKILISLGIILLVIIIGLFVLGFISSKNGNVITKNDGTTYTFKIQQKGNKFTKNGIQFLKFDESDNTIVVAATKGTNSGDCTTTPGAVSAFNVDINGTSYPVCANSQKLIYSARFSKDNTWHNIIIFSQDLKTTPDQNVMKRIISSVQVN